MSRLRGAVKWFDPEKGWGFIRLEDGEEVFVHHSDIQGEGFRSLKDGAEVELEVERADRGPRARRVEALGGSGRSAAGTGNGGTGRADRRRTGGRSRPGGNRDRRRAATGAREEPDSGALPTLDEQLRRRLAFLAPPRD